MFKTVQITDFSGLNCSCC